MILLVDQGNTRAKACLFDGEEISEIFALDNFSQQIPEQFKAVSKVYIASVASSEKKQQLKHWCKQSLGTQAVFFDSGKQFGQLVNAYQNISKMGVDRWCAMVAAWSRVENTVMIVDIGTAMTLDAIGADGRHIGGQIVAAYPIVKAGFQIITPQLPELSDDHSRVAMFAKDTHQAMRSGYILSAVATIEYFYQQLKIQQANQPEVFLCGGYASNISALLNIPHIIEPKLVFYGMAELLEKDVQSDRKSD